MRKAFVLMVLVLLTGTAAFAEAPMGGVQMLIGKIKSVTPGNIQTGILSQLVLVDGSGKESKLSLSNKTLISDKTGNKLTIEKLVAGEMVKVKSNDGKDAASILVQG